MTLVHYDNFVNLRYRPKSTDVLCQFKVIPAKGYTFRDVCSIVAGESSIGTWTEVKTMNPSIGKNLTPKVYYLNEKQKRCRIAYPLELFELGNLPEIMSSIGGNIYGMKSAEGIRWEDVRIPEKMLKAFKGPKFGIEGVRKYLGVFNRPLIGTIVKPKVGLTSEEHAKVAYDSWIGGCDIVKDDENLTSQNFNQFQKRFKATIDACKKAEEQTGERKIYFINCTAEAEEMIRRIKFVEKHGGNYIMLDILTLGWGALQTARNNTNLPIHAHRAGHAMFDRNPDQGMSMEVIAQLARMVGVDSLHIGTAFGKMSGSRDEVLHIEEEIESQSTEQTTKNLSQKWHGVKPVFAVASGGVYPALVPKIMQFMGKDVVLQAGGGIHGHPFGTEAGARAMRQAVDATLRKIPLKDYARTHVDLEVALKKWK
jgi:ribulose-bisphosphate carboxylase large chain